MKGLTLMIIWSFINCMVAYWLPHSMGVPLLLALFPWCLWLVGAINPTYKLGEF